MTWYFEAFPTEVWRPFFWEEHRIARLIGDHPGYRQYFIGSRAPRIADVTLLFGAGIPPEERLAHRRLERIVRRDPDPFEIDTEAAVLCWPGDPRYSHLRLLRRIVDPVGRPSIDLRAAAAEADTDQNDHDGQ
jgi:hypothetical protein